MEIASQRGVPAPAAGPRRLSGRGSPDAGDGELEPLAFFASAMHALGAAAEPTAWQRLRFAAVVTVLASQQAAWVYVSVAGGTTGAVDASGMGLAGFTNNVAFLALAAQMRSFEDVRRRLAAAAAPVAETRALDRRMRRIAIAFLVAYALACSGMTVLALLGPSNPETGQRPLPLPLYSPIDPSTPRGYVFTVSWHVAIQTVYVLMMPVAGPAMVAMMAHVALQLRSVAASIVALGRAHDAARPWTDARERLRRCVDDHKAALGLVDDVDKILQMPLATQLLVCAIMFCAMAHLLTMEGTALHAMVRELGLMAPFVVQLYAYCYVGEQVRKEGEAVAAAVWNCGWEDGAVPLRVRKDLLMVLTRAQKPTRITAMRIADVTLYTFGETMKLSYSYYNLLNNKSKEQ